MSILYSNLRASQSCQNAPKLKEWLALGAGSRFAELPAAKSHLNMLLNAIKMQALQPKNTNYDFAGNTIDIS